MILTIAGFGEAGLYCAVALIEKMEMVRRKAEVNLLNIVKTSSLEAADYGNILIGLSESRIFAGFRPHHSMPFFG